MFWVGVLVGLFVGVFLGLFFGTRLAAASRGDDLLVASMAQEKAAKSSPSINDLPNL
jgi:hypothetical protein